MKSLIRPDDIDTLFWQLNAKPEALALSQTVVPDAHPQSRLISYIFDSFWLIISIGNAADSQAQHHIALISVLDVLRDAASLLVSTGRCKKVPLTIN